MSPEQVRCDEIDGRSDLFSLGSVLYFASTGHTPFAADTVYKLMQKIADEPVSPPSHWNADLPSWFDALVLKLLDKNPACRFDSAEQLAEALEMELAYLQQPQSTPVPQRDWLQPIPSRYGRRAGWVTAIVALAATLFVGLIVWPPSTWSSKNNQLQLSTPQIEENDPSKQLPLPEDLQPWADKIIGQSKHQPVAFQIVPEMLVELKPEQSIEVAKAVWPALRVKNVKTAVLKGFYFGRHENALQVLDLGATDSDEEVRKYAFAYISDVALKPFSINPQSYPEWYKKTKQQSFEQIYRNSYEDLANRIRGAGRDVGKVMLSQLNVDFGMGGRQTAYPEEIPAVQATDVGETLLRWFKEGNYKDQDLAQILLNFPFTDSQVKELVTPLLETNLPDDAKVVLAMAIKEKELARELLLKRLRQLVKEAPFP